MPGPQPGYGSQPGPGFQPEYGPQPQPGARPSEGGTARSGGPIHGAPAPRGGQASPQGVKGRGLRTVLWILGVLLGVGLLLQGTVFRLNRTQVVGCSLRTPEEVAALAGLVTGQNIFTLDRKSIEAGINADRYLIFRDMRVDYPDGLTIYVAERSPCATFQHLGIQYTADSTGVILEETEKLTMTVQPGVVVVTGLNPSKLALGSIMTLEDAFQLSAYQAVMTELSLQNYLSEISELNVSDLDNLYLVSMDGISVRLGDQAQMQAKIGSLRAVRQWVLEEGKADGSIDVSAPLAPTYSP